MLFNLMFIVFAVNQVMAMSINPEQPAAALLRIVKKGKLDSTDIEQAKNLIQRMSNDDDLNLQNK